MFTLWNKILYTPVYFRDISFLIGTFIQTSFTLLDEALGLQLTVNYAYVQTDIVSNFSCLNTKSALKFINIGIGLVN